MTDLTNIHEMVSIICISILIARLTPTLATWL
jgi:hypothetical protein